MNSHGGLSVEAAGVRAKVCVEGDVTEAMDFSLVLQTDAEELILDLRALRRINSGGVHNWLSFVERLASDGKQVYYEWAPEAFLSQMAMIPKFEGSGVLRSLQLTYRCPDCDGAETRYYRCDPSGEPAAELVGPPCKVCGSATDLDALLEPLKLAGLCAVGAPDA